MKLLYKLGKFLFSRVFIVAVMLLIQVAFIIVVVLASSRYSTNIYVILHIISALVALWLISQDGPPEFKITWIVFVLAFPIVGGIFYLLLGNRRIPTKLRKRIQDNSIIMEDYLPNHELLPNNEYNQLHANYVHQISEYPVHKTFDHEYYAVGDTMFIRMMEEMEQAQKYICLEFFIVSPGRMLDDILALLERKIKQGVKVFFLYDDFGTMFNLPKAYRQKMKAIGIQICVFNPFRPHLSAMLNHRDHRKIVLIDGITAFTGGINIADEYINQKERFGHWKDTGVLVRGEAAWALGVMFFQQWNFAGGTPVKLEDYQPEAHLLDPPEGSHTSGLVQVLAEIPTDDHNVIETVHKRAIQQAVDYVYIATPYLVIDFAMQEALCAAAQSGVEVCLFVPYIYDKWYVHTLTTSHYKHLIQSGVKIFEYTPGFLHAKMFVSDDRIGMVGSCNMDFRSFYLHFENSVLFFESDILHEIKADMLETREVSKQVTLEKVNSFSFIHRILQYLLKIFAPLM